jgi:cell division protein FtsB
MTIIEPNKHKKRINFFLILILLLLLLGAFLNIYLYNYIVNLRHTITSFEKKMHELEVANADFKNDLYKIRDNSNLMHLIDKFKLVKENKPEYLENPWAVASHY